MVLVGLLRWYACMLRELPRGPPLDAMVLVGLLRWHACMLRELPSGELLYRSYRLAKQACSAAPVQQCL
jgi:hypothetical protein